MTIPLLQIRQTPGMIQIDSDPGRLSIRQPKAELNITTEPGQLEIHQYRPELEVDQSRARAAYNGGSSLEMNQRIYSGIQQIFLQGLARRVEEGNQVAAIYNPGNTIAAVYGQDWQAVPFPEFRGEASMDNVETRFRVTPPDIRISKTRVDVQTVTHKAEIEYTRGKLEIYMKQYPSVHYIPPELDITH